MAELAYAPVSKTGGGNFMRVQVPPSAPLIPKLIRERFDLLKIGVHVSIAGKIYYSIERASRLGCSTMQIFARNPRQFRKGTLKKNDILTFRKKVKEAKISPVVIHAPYTLNLASAKKFFYGVSIKEFTRDVREANLLGADYMVIHTGSFKGDDKEGLSRVANALKIVLRDTARCKTTILLENTAGDGSNLGYAFSHHNYIFKKLKNPKRLGLCLDTCHSWCAGYRINTKKGLDKMVDEIEKEVGIDKIKVIHLNDTLDDLGSRKDRHFHIGKGKIGVSGFRLIVNHPKLKSIPLILETPKKSDDDDLTNLASVNKLYKKS